MIEGISKEDKTSWFLFSVLTAVFYLPVIFITPFAKMIADVPGIVLPLISEFVFTSYIFFGIFYLISMGWISYLVFGKASRPSLYLTASSTALFFISIALFVIFVVGVLTPFLAFDWGSLQDIDLGY